MDTIGITLRGYDADDLEGLYQLDVACFEPAFRFTRAAMRRFAQVANARVVVAESAGQIVGFAILHVERSRSGRMGYIVTLDVDPTRRRQGIAGMLMAEIEEQARSARCDALELHVHAGNAGAIGFYARIGFEEVGVEPGFYGRGLDGQVWRKALTEARAL